MKILYCAMKYDYGRADQGYSFEHCNFYETLTQMNHEIIYFDFMSIYQKYGRDEMNRRLWNIVKSKKPDLMFTMLFKDELDQTVIRRISEETGTTTINWFCDDHWRFESFSSKWAPCFNWVVTTAQSALPKYTQAEYANIVKSQWACNHFTYRKLDLPLIHDVTFIGQPHGDRRQYIQALLQANIKVKTWGNGWPNGRLDQAEMIKVFNQSRINLNLANSSTATFVTPKLPAPLRQLSRPLNTFPAGLRLKKSAKHWLSVRKAKSAVPNVNVSGNREQIKGRNFEVPGCGGFLLTGKADNLEDYYVPDKEIVCFDDVKSLVDKVKYYLAHDDERQAIAQAGYERTLREHTYQHRFNDIFDRLGLYDRTDTGNQRTKNQQTENVF